MAFPFLQQNLSHIWLTFPRRITSARKINGNPTFDCHSSTGHVNLYSLRLPRIKAWIDANNPGDPLIPFSVALEERLAPLSAEDKAEEEKDIGANSALGKITQAGYTSLDVNFFGPCTTTLLTRLIFAHGT
jgi:hypothetical protein